MRSITFALEEHYIASQIDSDTFALSGFLLGIVLGGALHLYLRDLYWVEHYIASHYIPIHLHWVELY